MTDTLTDLGFTRPAYHARAACTGTGVDFFADSGPGMAKARAICATCPVNTECLDHALRNHEHHGVWGGTSERQRVVLRRAQGIRKIGPAGEVPHGTQSGYCYHRCRCEACTAASTAHQAAWRARRKATGYTRTRKRTTAA